MPEQSQTPQSANPPAQPTSTPPEVSQPFAIPTGMTPEAAAVRSRELTADKEFGARLIKGGKDSVEARELDALQRHSIGAEQPKAGAKVLTPAEARAAALEEVPATPEGYENLPFRHDDMPTPEGRTEIQGLIHTAGLTRSEAATMVSFAANDVIKWASMDDGQRDRHVNDSLARFGKMHGDQAPAMLDGARRLVAEITAKDGGRLREFLEESGAGVSLALIETLAAAAKRRYGTQPGGVTPKRPVGR